MNEETKKWVICGHSPEDQASLLRQIAEAEELGKMHYFISVPGCYYEIEEDQRTQSRDPHQLRLNSYRVLLTRGREGLILFVPDETEMNSTFEALISAGVRELPSAGGIVGEKVVVGG